LSWHYFWKKTRTRQSYLISCNTNFCESRNVEKSWNILTDTMTCCIPIQNKWPSYLKKNFSLSALKCWIPNFSSGAILLVRECRINFYWLFYKSTVKGNQFFIASQISDNITPITSSRSMFNKQLLRSNRTDENLAQYLKAILHCI
jgi:hypothetical protein